MRKDAHHLTFKRRRFKKTQHGRIGLHRVFCRPKWLKQGKLKNSVYLIFCSIISITVSGAVVLSPPAMADTTPREDSSRIRLTVPNTSSMVGPNSCRLAF